MALSSKNDVSGTGGAVAGASITIGGKTVTTAADGSYSTPLIEPGTYTAVVSTPYSFNREFTVVISAQDLVNVNAAVVNCDYNKDGYVNVRDFNPNSPMTAQEKSNFESFINIKDFVYPSLSYS